MSSLPKILLSLLPVVIATFAALIPPHTEAGISTSSGFRLAPLFSDSMVIQRQAEVRLWGRGSPGMTVAVRPSWGSEESERVDADGSWLVSIQTPPAGGPHRIELVCGDTLVLLNDVITGEVWLCSGQSNMEMPLEGWPPRDSVEGSGEVIRNSRQPMIRLFTVPRTYSVFPEVDCSGRWLTCSPGTVSSFSATAYFFGKMLSDSLRVPIGLIHASWGGTPAQAWMSAKALEEVPEFARALEQIDSSRALMHDLLDWMSKFPVQDVASRERETRWSGLELGDAFCALPDFPDGRWPEMDLPTLWEETNLGEFDGAVWFRKQVTIPGRWLGRDLVLELGPIDDVDRSYVNGLLVGSQEEEGNWTLPRVYRVPRAAINDTTLHVAVRVIDYQGGGGIYGGGQKMILRPADGDGSVSLEGAWRYLAVAEYRGGKLTVYGAEGERFLQRPRLSIGLSPRTPTVLYNGMISPLIPATLAGVIWYQGEANAGNPELYQRLFPLLIGDWRRSFGSKDLPFLYVQIAPYSYEGSTESQYLREAQLKTLSVQNTGMVVTLDIGNPHNIHPANKRDVGERLGRIGLTRVYGWSLPYSGPILRSVERRGSAIELMFDHADGGLVLKEAKEGHGFLIAGEDRNFLVADVVVHGDTLIVAHPEIKKPLSVRYAFANTAEATLFNRAGLPASSFRTDSWERESD